MFITMLVGGGMAISAVAWVLDKLGSRLTTPAAERGLARRLSVLRFPPDGLMADEAELLAQSLPGSDDPRLRLVDDHLAPVGSDRYRFVLRPSLDASDRKEVAGCLQDWRIDHLRLHVIEMLPVPLGAEAEGR